MSDPIDVTVTDGSTAIVGRGFGDDGSGDFSQSVTSGSGVGVRGIADVGSGVQGDSQDGTGVYGSSYSLYGVVGSSRVGTGVSGFGGTAGDGVFGTTQAAGMSGVAGIHAGNGHGVYGRADGDGFAGWFEGNVTVTGDIVSKRHVTVTGNVTVAGDVVLSSGHGDCAEEFDIASTEHTEPGMVVVLDQQGALQPSYKAYDKTVAGVISGAGDYKPGLILDKKEPSESRMPVALIGKVYCKVDAQYASIEVGDLLTTSPTIGHAMKADDPFKAFGAVIGKALRPLQAGQGMIPILIALQ
ncbi:hypothetical protein KSC_032090 [Ktedonobacter sp. SOSP1-52]|uniref:hypothetical protein n=1 Tax=Ktedonobacter sp. SOSP1-52 TaxID=2778366 RepID=UPI0019151811|nr:hypothetical protein [Ktedonobacter sp. SOSP1-52]GHO63362.1 hypothetical protein KSC_022540 [Ktedonobacter sp. SOSP1-52]GHO64317.1 hypothetical protein KSC_032090 [Ktedonobacter sp. SOSP1-52]